MLYRITLEAKAGRSRTVNDFIGINQMRYRYEESFTLHIENLEIKKGEFIFLVGRNGSGKTTFLNLLHRDKEPLSGDITLDGQSLSTMDEKDLAKYISVIEQEVSFTFGFCVMEYVKFGRYLNQKKTFFDSEEDEALAVAALKQVGLENYENKSVLELSGGQKRRVQIARMLVQEAQVFLLDEPEIYLDNYEKMRLFEILYRLNQESGKTILVVTHDESLFHQYGGRLLRFKEGRMTEDMTKDRLK